MRAMLPGRWLAVSGAVAMGAVGTVTYVNGQTVYAFGHELDGAGRRSLLLQDAYVYYVVNNPDPTVAPSYKLAVPGHTVGLVSSDTPNAVIGEVGAPPRSVPVDVTAHDLDTGRSIALDTQVAGETGVDRPLGTSQVDAIAPLEVAQAATQIFNGPPADETARMCLRIYLHGIRAPLGSAGELSRADSGGHARSGRGVDPWLFANLPGHVTRRIFRDRARLITGQTVLPFVVAGYRRIPAASPTHGTLVAARRTNGPRVAL